MVEFNHFKNIGFLLSKFTQEQLQPVRDEILKIQKNFEDSKKANYSLSGHIKKEYFLSESKTTIEHLILPLIVEYDGQYKNLSRSSYLTKSCEIVLDDVWVNFQKKHEFNPPHTHGGLMSFVIWINVPFDIKNEQSMFPDIDTNGATNNYTANFMFHYIDSIGKIGIAGLPVDKSWENKIALFPSSMMHSVHPL